MSAIANVQCHGDSPSTLLLRFGSLHRSAASVEEEGEDFYRSEFLDQSSQPSHKDSTSGVWDSLASVPQLQETKPLVIKKRSKAASRMPLSPLIHERRPSINHPRSPLSPRIPRARGHSISSSSAQNFPSHRSRSGSIGNGIPLSAIAITPFTNVGLNFLNMPTDESDPFSQSILLAHHRPDGSSPRFYAVDRASLASLRKGSLTDSELHLNLGQWSLWDDPIQPGHSPSTTPVASPTKRTFDASSKDESRGSRRRFGNAASKQRQGPRQEPMTPSRAPSKAVQFLGTSSEYQKIVSSSKREANAKPTKKRENFRPLPSAVGREINSFFGASADAPKKGAASAKYRTGKPLPAPPPGLIQRNLGEGSTVEYKGEDGQVWADTEEAAEFAWLLSECGRGGEQLLPGSFDHRRRSLSSAESSPSDQLLIRIDTDDGDDVVRINGGTDSDGTGYSDTDGEDPFGMTSFHSVYNIPKPHKAPFIIGAKAAETLGIYSETSKKPANPGRNLPFLSLDPYASPSNRTGGSKRRPPPLTLRHPSSKGPSVVAIQHEFIDSSFVPSFSSKGKDRMGIAVGPRSTSLTVPHGMPTYPSAAANSRFFLESSKYLAPRDAPLPPQTEPRGRTSTQSRSSSQSILGALNSSPPRKSNEEAQREAWMESQAKGESFFEASPMESTFFKSKIQKIKKVLK